MPGEIEAQYVWPYQLNQAMASEETMDLFPCFTWEFSLAEFVAGIKSSKWTICFPTMELR